MGGQRVHVGIDMQNCLVRSASAQLPMHGVALIEAGAKDDQHIGGTVEDRRRCVAGAGIAEDAER